MVYVIIGVGVSLASIRVMNAIGLTHSGIKAIADYIGAVPLETNAKYLSGYLISCEHVEKLPVINIVINYHVYRLHGDDYVYPERVVDAKQNLCKTALIGYDSGVFYWSFYKICFYNICIITYSTQACTSNNKTSDG